MGSDLKNWGIFVGVTLSSKSQERKGSTFISTCLTAVIEKRFEVGI
jgi:hypothetical protein